jgi:hypothetical protein
MELLTDEDLGQVSGGNILSYLVDAGSMIIDTVAPLAGALFGGAVGSAISGALN